MFSILYTMEMKIDIIKVRYFGIILELNKCFYFELVAETYLKLINDLLGEEILVEISHI